MTGRVVAGVLALTTLFACGCGDKASSPASVGRTRFTIAPEPFKPQASFTFSYIPVTISFTDGAIKFKIAKKWVTKYGTFEWGNEAAVAKIEIERPGAVVFQWGNQGYWLDVKNDPLFKEDPKFKPLFARNKLLKGNPLFDLGSPSQLGNLTGVWEPAPNLAMLTKSRLPSHRLGTSALVLPSATLLNAIKPFAQPAPIKDMAVSSDFTSEERQQIIDFIVEADRAETTARLTNNPAFITGYFADWAYDQLRAELLEARLRGRCEDARLDIAQSRLETIRRKPDFEIEADVVEVWSSTFYKPDTGAVVDHMASHEVPQTITIQQGDRGWRITKVHFRR